MNTVYQIDQIQLNELYDQLHHFELAFVKHATYQMFHLFGSPLHNYWQDENQAFGVYIVYYKLAQKYSRGEFISSLQKGVVPDEREFTEDEKNLVLNDYHLRHQARRLREFLTSLVDEFDYEVWLIEVGLQVPFRR